LRCANLDLASLDSADLTAAFLSGTQLEGATLTNTDLTNAFLKDANLSNVRNWTNQQLAQAESLVGATMPDGTVMTEAAWEEFKKQYRR
jgi:uncharacterized protein YjbI with pentapeptide repeats